MVWMDGSGNHDPGWMDGDPDPVTLDRWDSHLTLVWMDGWIPWCLGWISGFMGHDPWMDG